MMTKLWSPPIFSSSSSSSWMTKVRVFQSLVLHSFLFVLYTHKLGDFSFVIFNDPQLVLFSKFISVPFVTLFELHTHIWNYLLNMYFFQTELRVAPQELLLQHSRWYSPSCSGQILDFFPYHYTHPEHQKILWTLPSKHIPNDIAPNYKFIQKLSLL